MVDFIVSFRRELYVFSTIFLVFFLYAYIVYMYKAQRSGKRDYEKYSRIALDDDILDKPIESVDTKGS